MSIETQILQLLDNPRLLKRLDDRGTLRGFIRSTFKNYKMLWVHKEICDKLEQFLEDVIHQRGPRLMLCMPPRHGKSEIVSRRFPAYALGLYPDLSIIAASNTADLASRMNSDVQRIIDSPEYNKLFHDTKLPGVGVKNPGRWKRTSDLFEVINHKGSYRSAGVGGTITGMGCNILIIDDPIKSIAEADSETVRNHLYDWYAGVARTRVSPGGGILIINTRWHTDDLSGRLLAHSRDRWEVISYPAIATADEEHRKIGEPLAPELWSLAELEELKHDLGSRLWEAEYQQTPVAEGGNIFQDSWIQYYTALPQKLDTTIISWDMTFKDTSTSDFCVGQVWGRRGADIYLIDQVRGRMGFTETLHKFVALADKYPKALKKIVEDKANGPAVIDALRREVPGIVPVTPKESKTARAFGITPMWEAGNVWLPDPTIAPWIDDFVSELKMFPAGAHDDQVDAMTQALADLRKHRRMVINPKLLYA